MKDPIKHDEVQMLYFEEVIADEHAKDPLQILLEREKEGIQWYESLHKES